jgi:hypothetical protein
MVLYESGNLELAKEKLTKAVEGGGDFHGRDEAVKILEKL